MKELFDRLSSETPLFWKKIRNMAMGAVTVAGVVIILPTMGLAVPATLLTASQYILAIATTLGISAQATKTDKPNEYKDNGI